MRTITHNEIQESIDKLNAMSEKDTKSFMKQMSAEQPFIQIYVAAICDRGDFENESGADAFIHLASIIWHSMCAAAGGKIRQVDGDEIERHEKKTTDLYKYAENESEEGFCELAISWMKDYNQRPLLEFVLEALLSPENPGRPTQYDSGLIFIYSKIVIDCLDNAKVQ